MLKRFVALIAALAFVSDTLTAQAVGSAAPRVRITEAGRQTSGRLAAVDPEVVTIVPDGKRDPIRIPLSSVSAAEVSEGKRSRAVADLAGVGISLGVFVLIGTIVTSGNCHKDCKLESPLARVLPAVVLGGLGGVTSGLAVAHGLGRERWRRVPIASLVSLVTPAAP